MYSYVHSRIHSQVFIQLSIYLCIQEYTASYAFNFAFICAFAKIQLGMHSAMIFDSMYHVTIDVYKYNFMKDDVTYDAINDMIIDVLWRQET